MICIFTPVKINLLKYKQFYCSKNNYYGIKIFNSEYPCLTVCTEAYLDPLFIYKFRISKKEKQALAVNQNIHTCLLLLYILYMQLIFLSVLDLIINKPVNLCHMYQI